jgi:Flp pilus assembly pilin Flp
MQHTKGRYSLVWLVSSIATVGAMIRVSGRDAANTKRRRIEMERNELVDMNKKRKGQKGVTTVEYAVMLVLVAIAVMAATPGISSAVVGVFSNVTDQLN